MDAVVPDYMKDQTERIRAIAEAHREQIREYLKGTQIGQGRPTDAQVLEFIAEQQQKYPPVRMVSPDGREMFASPWLVLLGELDDDNADELVERYIKAATTTGAY